MSAARLDTLKEIFHSARALEPSEREAFLEEACGADELLRREIDGLLASDRAAHDFIAPPRRLTIDLLAEPPVFSEAGRIVGQYRLIERIGAGGMGAVYLAERADRQFEMRVAIKLIKRGMDTDAVLGRFQHERQILASLEHPNIARLLDGGTTDDGVPYFVMEYIQGERIDRYAEEHKLTVVERLELFRQVCSAVSYAHQRLVVHRDLKPSNILVTPSGVPKLLDFGIARIIQADDGTETLASMTAVPIMTPEYASPEQIQGARATTLSDVYSLGAVLYELVSGRPPIRLKSRSLQEIDKIATTQIAKPSTVVKPVEDARRLRGDVDNIVLMAMRKDTARRYPSVEQLSEDIRRHLAGRPVTARPDTLSYRAGKFVQRNRLALGAAALLLLTLIGGIIATTWQAHKARLNADRARAEQARAERRFNQVRTLAHSVLFDYHDAIKNLPGSTKVREQLVKDALTYLDSLAGEAQGDPALQRELAAAYERVGEVRGSLGDLAGAFESHTKAVGIRESLLALNPNDPEARNDLASSHKLIGSRLLDTKDAARSLEHLKKARALYLDLMREQPGNDELRLAFADTCHRLGRAMKQQGDLAGALDQLKTAMAICERLVASFPQEQRYRRVLWDILERTADVHFIQRDLADSISFNAKALALGEALIGEDPMNADYRRALVANYSNGGDYRKLSDKKGALEYFRRAVALEEELVAADPANAETRKELGYQHKRIADFLANMEDNSEALSHFRRAREIFEKLASDAPEDFISRLRVATYGAGVAGMQARLGEIDPALQECRKAIALLQETREEATNIKQRFHRAECYEYLGYAFGALAVSPKASTGEARQYRNSARNMFQECLNTLEDLRSRGALDPDSAEWAQTMAGEIAKCDAALAK